jgi:hypothetical protein
MHTHARTLTRAKSLVCKQRARTRPHTVRGRAHALARIIAPTCTHARTHAGAHAAISSQLHSVESLALERMRAQPLSATPTVTPTAARGARHVAARKHEVSLDEAWEEVLRERQAQAINAARC